MKYQKKVEQVYAQVFQWGMEDGVVRWNLIIPKETDDYSSDLHSIKYPGYLAIYDKELDERGFHQTEGFVPYIATPDGNKRISEGDYIITHENGVRSALNADLFSIYYEQVTSTTE